MNCENMENNEQIQPKNNNSKKGLIIGIIIAVLIIVIFFVLAIFGIIAYMKGKNALLGNNNKVTEYSEENYFDTSEDFYEKGIITDTTYESEFLGIRFVCPEGYTMESPSTTMDLMVINEAGDSNFSIVVGPDPIGINVDDYVTTLENNMNNMLPEDTSSEIRGTYVDELGGQTYDVIVIDTIAYGVPYTQEMYFKALDGYFVLITFTGETDILKEGFELY